MTTLDQLFLNSGGEDFIVFFKNTGFKDHNMSWCGEVYPIMYFDEENKKFSYYNDHNSNPEENKDKARCFFHFSYCWRGVWEGRFYPKQEEYWGEDVSELNDLWNQIEKIIRDKIKFDNTDYEYFD
jgi:hypothetical protein